MTLPGLSNAVFLAAVAGLVAACGAAAPRQPSNPSVEPVQPATAGPRPAATSQTTRSEPIHELAGAGEALPSAQDPAKQPQGTPQGTDRETFPSGLIVDQTLLGGPAPGPELPKGTRVLHVGDSFAGALGIELNKVLNGAGLKSRLEFEKSTYIPTWAHSSKLANLLQTFKPDLVLISLGANELENPEPDKRAPLIQKLVKSLGETPCVWVAPVLWDGAKSALLEVIRANAGRCVYLDSNELIKKMPRAGDKIHPSMAARPDWAAATARWLAYHRKPTESQPWHIGPAL